MNGGAENQGDAPSASTTLRYYLSTDTTITTSDTEIGTASVNPLGPSGGYRAGIRPTAPSTPGTYYYGACVDSVSGELDTTNNCSTVLEVVVGAAPVPDLVVDASTVSESAPAAGARFTLSAMVRNQGDGRSDSTTLRYYRSTDATITTSDTSVGTDSVSGLNASGSSPESISLTAPSTSGTYYYGACVDSASDESDTTNNCSPAVTVTIGAVTAPDLVVDTPTVMDNSAITGATFTLNATVRNQGNGASASAWLRFYHSSDTTITSSDALVSANIYVDGLNPSGSSAKWANLTAPSTAGTYYYGACVESVTGESDTMNNCSAAVTLTVGTPDLVVDSPTVSDSASTAGGGFKLSATVRNQGIVSSGSTALRYYRSADTTITTDDTRVGSYVSGVDPLSPSSTSTYSINLTAPTTTGTYYYGACVDSVTGESDTTNNCSAAVTVTITAPDLVVDTHTVTDSSPTAGASFTVNVTVRNHGDATSGSATLSYYRSTDSTITASDTEVGTDSVPRLDALESSAESISLTAPITTGTYYYGVCVAPVTGESDTTNNCSAAVTVVVSVASAPDAPTGLTATGDGQTEIDLSWTAPSDDGGTNITGYKIEVSTDGSSWSDLEANTRSTSTTYSHTGLTAGSTRYYRVSAINSAGTGSVSNVGMATTVSQPNRAPVAVGTIPDWVSVPDGWEWLDVSSYFSDPDDDTLSYSAVSSDTAVAISDSVLGSRVFIRALELGTATVTVTARDPGGLEATQAISVTVKYPNRRPETVGSISTQTIVVSQTIAVDVSPYFRDPDDDLLSYEVSPSDANAIGVSVSGSTVNIEARAVSAALVTFVTVTASDPDGLQAVLRIDVRILETVNIRITECFIFQNQHFARFKATARVSVSSLVVKTYAVDSRNNDQHLMETIDIGNLSAGNSHEELTSRFFPAHLARFLTTCGVSAIATSN